MRKKSIIMIFLFGLALICAGCAAGSSSGYGVYYNYCPYYNDCYYNNYGDFYPYGYYAPYYYGGEGEEEEEHGGMHERFYQGGEHERFEHGGEHEGGGHEEREFRR